MVGEGAFYPWAALSFFFHIMSFTPQTQLSICETSDARTQGKNTLKVTTVIKDVYEYTIYPPVPPCWPVFYKVHHFSLFPTLACAWRGQEKWIFICYALCSNYSIFLAFVYSFTKSGDCCLMLIFLCAEEVEGLLRKISAAAYSEE